MFYDTQYESPLGLLTLASDGENLTGLWMENQKYFAAHLPAHRQERANLPLFIQTKKWLDTYFQGDNPSVGDLPLAPKGGGFYQKVWKILCEIPYGHTMTYGEIAKIVAPRTGQKTMSAQAVGGAVGHNPICIIIPCHRVIGQKGNLTGYAGGLDKKIKLLELEGVNVASFFCPKKGTAL